MSEPRKGLMRSLGEFTGHIIKGLRTPAESSRHEVSRSVEETTGEDGITLRRTVIDEVEIPAESPGDESDEKDRS